jgi:hypothetical protein
MTCAASGYSSRAIPRASDFQVESTTRCLAVAATSRKGQEIWLGGLDSNQDSQIQSLESYQLDDLPSVGFAPTRRGSTGKEQKGIVASSRGSGQPRFYSSNLIGILQAVNRGANRKAERHFQLTPMIQVTLPFYVSR